MPAPLPESSVERAFYRLGYLLEELSQHADGKPGAGGPSDQLRRAAVAAALTRVLRPRKVGWPRLLAATLVGTAVGELLTGFGMDGLTDEELDARLEAEVQRQEAAEGRSRRAHPAVLGDEELDDEDLEAGTFADDGLAEDALEDEVLEDAAAADLYGAVGEAYASDAAGAYDQAEELDEDDLAGEVLTEDELAEEEEIALREAALEAGQALGRRAAANLATAAAYAALIHPRLPGPSMLRALAFGVLDAGTGAGGGAVAVLRGLAPRVRFPLSRLHTPGTERAAARALALAIALGLIYRAPAEDENDDA